MMQLWQSLLITIELNDQKYAKNFDIDYKVNEQKSKKKHFPLKVLFKVSVCEHFLIKLSRSALWQKDRTHRKTPAVHAEKSSPTADRVKLKRGPN